MNTPVRLAARLRALIGREPVGTTYVPITEPELTDEDLAGRLESSEPLGNHTRLRDP